ncbi:MAG: metallophosphoesterase family protein [Clostridium sp.]|uniref:metallophosphoesterase family protein n=1 Tax=Clostridium sp. TaxID=1506 RepID=UPI003D6C797D
MIKIGIITDIHNNVVALESILKLFEYEKCDEIICCGDIIGIGPFRHTATIRVI